MMHSDILTQLHHTVELERKGLERMTWHLGSVEALKAKINPLTGDPSSFLSLFLIPLIWTVDILRVLAQDCCSLFRIFLCHFILLINLQNACISGSKTSSTGSCSACNTYARIIPHPICSLSIASSWALKQHSCFEA